MSEAGTGFAIDLRGECMSRENRVLQASPLDGYPREALARAGVWAVDSRATRSCRRRTLFAGFSTSLCDETSCIQAEVWPLASLLRSPRLSSSRLSIASNTRSFLSSSGHSSRICCRSWTTLATSGSSSSTDAAFPGQSRETRTVRAPLHFPYTRRRDTSSNPPTSRPRLRASRRGRATGRRPRPRSRGRAGRGASGAT